MKRKTVYNSTIAPKTSVGLPDVRISRETLDSLGSTLQTIMSQAFNDREEMRQDLAMFNAMYEVDSVKSETPVPDSPNIVIPIVANAIDELVSRLCGSVLLPRPYCVRGNNDNSGEYSHAVEQFYNNAYSRFNQKAAYRAGIQLAARDGTGFMEVLWKTETVERTVMADVINPDGSQTRQRQRLKFEISNNPDMQARALEDVVVFPAYATSIDSAGAVFVRDFMKESDAMKLAATAANPDGPLDVEAIDRAFSYVSTAQGDLSQTGGPKHTYTMGGEINISDTSVAPPDGMKMDRGPLEVWRMHTSLFDLDNDGVCEENIIWFHLQSMTVLGVAPFEYLQGRPFIPIALIPRPNRIYGVPVIKRMAGLQDETNTQHNARLVYLLWRLKPLFRQPKSSRLRDEDRGIFPGKVLEGEQNDFGFISLPDVPTSSLDEEQLLRQYAGESTGSPQAPAAGQPSSGGSHQSARQAQQNAALKGMQTNLMLDNIRDWMQNCYEYMHRLYAQYGPDQLEAVQGTQDSTQRVDIPNSVLALDYTLTIAGQGGPLDKENRRNDWAQMSQYLQQLPFVQADIGKQWNIAAEFLQSADINDATRFIGTKEEAEQMQQQHAQAQQQAQMEERKQELIKAAMRKGLIQPDSEGGQHGQAQPS